MNPILQTNLAIWPVLLPLVGAPLAVLIGAPRGAWALALACAIGSTIASAALLMEVLVAGPVSYHLGGWEPPYGIEYLIDEFNGLVLLLVSGLAALCLAYSGVATESEIDAKRRTVFYALFLLCLTGLLGITATADAFNVFVFLEISSLATYGLVAAGTRPRAVLAALQYLILGTLGGSFLLIGVGLFYQATGTLNMADLADRLPDAPMARVVLAGFLFVLLGLALKSAIFPVHQWLPNVYAEAPSAVGAFLAGAATKVAIYALARLGIGVLGVAYFLDHGAQVLQWLAIAGMLYGSVLAMRQTEVRRILAYSSLAQIGYLAFGFALATAEGISASIIHVVNHALIKCLLFLAIGGVIFRCGSGRLEDLGGLIQRMPWTFWLLVVGGCGLIGVPLTAGFVSKWYLLGAAIEAGAWAGVAAMLISSVLAFVYVGRILEAAWFAPAENRATPRQEAPVSMIVPALTIAGLVIWLGVDSGALVAIADTAALRLMGVGG